MKKNNLYSIKKVNLPRRKQDDKEQTHNQKIKTANEKTWMTFQKIEQNMN